MRNGNLENADKVLTNSISLGNTSTQTLILLAELKLALRDWENAEGLARQIGRQNGQEARSQYILGLVFGGRNQREASIQAFERAYELSPAMNQPILALIQIYLKGGEPEKARDFLESIILERPDDATAYLLLGELDLSEQNFPAARNNFLKAIKRDRSLEAAYRNLANLYLRDGEDEKAEKLLGGGLAANPDNVYIATALASVYERTRQYDKAIELYESLLHKNPDLVIAKNNLANLLIDHVSSEQGKQRALQISKDFMSSNIPQLQDTYAWAVINTGGNIDQAIRILQRIVEDHNTEPAYSYHLGEAYFMKGEMGKAAQFFDEAVKLGNPDSRETALALSRLQEISR